LTITIGTGGAAIKSSGSTTGGAGGVCNATAGIGGDHTGATSSTGTGGAGGGMNLSAGGGGQSTAATGTAVGGAGGTLFFSGGTGGQTNSSGATTGTAGRGGDAYISGGTGGNGAAGATVTGGTGGDVYVRSGNGQDGTGSTHGTGGNGGNVFIQAQWGGQGLGAGAHTDGSGGYISLQTALTAGASPTEIVNIDNKGNFAFGTGAGGSIATNATNGFIYIETCAGTPTGTPTSKTGLVPLIYDLTNKKLWVYDTGLSAWKGVNDVTTQTAYLTGTAYSLTNSAAAITGGTTSPTLTIADAGVYRVEFLVSVKFNGATFGSSQDATFKLRRTNNTAADLTSGTSPAKATGIITTFTAHWGDFYWVGADYTATAGDIITIFGSLSATPSVGTVDVIGGFIRITRLN
jgi:hypothetical protein